MGLTGTPSIRNDLITPKGLIQTQPSNRDPLHNTNFQFKISRLPTINFFVQSANIPGLAIGVIDQQNPFVAIPHAGDAVFEDLEIQFLVDEDLANWREVFNWIKEISLINDRESIKSYDAVHSDATLILTTNKSNPNISLSFKNMFPTGLSGLSFDNTSDTSEPVTATVTFRFTYYEVEVI